MGGVGMRLSPPWLPSALGLGFEGQQVQLCRKTPGGGGPPPLTSLLIVSLPPSYSCQNHSKLTLGPNKRRRGGGVPGRETIPEGHSYMRNTDKLQ